MFFVKEKRANEIRISNCSSGVCSSDLLLMDTEYGGVMRIKFEHVATLQSDGELVVSDQSLRRSYLAKLGRAESGQVTLVGLRRDADGARTPVDDSVPLSEVERVVRPKPLIRDTLVSGTLDLGLSRKSASTESQDYSADRKSTRLNSSH